jgi:hypothetical protein
MVCGHPEKDPDMPEPQVTIPLSAVHGLTEFLSAIGVSVSPARLEPEDIPDWHFRSAREAVENAPHIYGTEYSVKWKLRNLDSNGLLESGAVVEQWNRPDQSRPSLTIIHRNWMKWARKNQEN